jgi:hypothetical protein
MNEPLSSAVRDFFSIERRVARIKLNGASELRAQLLPLGRDRARKELLPVVAELYGCAIVHGERKAAGNYVLNPGDPQYESAKKGLFRLLKDIFD